MINIEKLADEAYPQKGDKGFIYRECFISGFQKCQELNEPKWISVEDELPTINQSVLVYFKSNWGKVDVFKTDTLCVDGWQNTSDGVITHWSTLPTPSSNG